MIQYINAWFTVSCLLLLGAVMFIGIAVKKHHTKKRELKQSAVPSRVYDFFQY